MHAYVDFVNGRNVINSDTKVYTPCLCSYRKEKRKRAAEEGKERGKD